jgi:transmembrane sensor
MNPSTNSAEIEAAAAAWFAKRESGDWNAADQAQLEAWLDSSTACRIAFIRIATAWERSGRLNALGAGVPPGTIPPRGAWAFAPNSNVSPSGIPQKRLKGAADPQIDVAPLRYAILATRKPGVTIPGHPRDACVSPMANTSHVRTLPQARFRRNMGAIAALLVVATTVGAAWYVSKDHADSYRTPIGAITTVPLSDGSKITLNTDSQIHVELNPTMRRIKLDQGEAFFEVAKDAARSFVVEIADKRVVAVGTKFSVRRDNNDIRVLVTEGQVRIERRGSSSKAAQTQLAAGSEARTAQAAVLIDQPAPARVEQLLSWRTGYIMFRDTALADAVADFNRYTARKIVIEDPAIAGIRIGGNFRSDDADAFLWLLQSGFPINVEARGDRIILTKR